MGHIAIVYATGEGQTAKVTEHIIEHLEDLGHSVDAHDVAVVDSDMDLSGYDALLIGASIHRGTHQKRIKSFVSEHLAALQGRPSGFFQVSLSAAIEDEEHQAEALGYVEDLIEETGWHPDRTAIFGGAIRYSQYGFLTRLLLKSIAKKETGDTDTSRDYEYTDWEEVRRFAQEFAAFLVDKETAQTEPEQEVVD